MEQRISHKPDWVLILTVLLQIIIGIAFIYSVSGGYDEYIKENHPGRTFYFNSYLEALALSLLMMGVVFKFYSTQFIEKYAYWFVGLAFILIIATLIPGVGWTVNGATRSIRTGLTTIYVAPMATLFLIMGASRYMTEHFNHKQAVFLPVLKIIALFFLLAILFFCQPDNKLTVLLGFLLIIASYSIKQSKLCLISILSLLIAVIGIALVKPLFFEHLARFYAPFEHSLDSGYQLLASLSSIGGGDLWGVGFGHGLEKHFYFPGAHQGFMFSSITEEIGAVGAIFIILCFAMILWRSLRMVPDLFLTNRIFEGLLVTGISSWIALLGIFHISACLGVIPVANVYLPFISYDKASLFATLMGAAMIIKIGSTVDIANKKEPINHQPLLIVFLSLFLVLGLYTFSKAVIDKKWDKQYQQRVNTVTKVINHRKLNLSVEVGK